MEKEQLAATLKNMLEENYILYEEENATLALIMSGNFYFNKFHIFGENDETSKTILEKLKSLIKQYKQYEEVPAPAFAAPAPAKPPPPPPLLRKAPAHMFMQKNPMLASTYKPGQALNFPLYAQPKLDGYRMMYDSRTHRATSRTGLALDVPHIMQELSTIDFSDHVLDGELYLHGKKFQEIQKLVNENSPHLEFWIFDFAGDGTFKERHNELVSLSKRVPATAKHIKFVRTEQVSSLPDIEELHDKYEKEGYEGIMLRVPSSTYVESRSPGLMKKKRFMEDEFEVVSFKSRKDNVGIVWQCKTREGNLFWANDPSGSVDGALKKVGAHLTVKFQELSNKGVPRFPVAKGFRGARDFKAASDKKPSPAQPQQRPQKTTVQPQKPRNIAVPAAAACHKKLPAPLNVIEPGSKVEYEKYQLSAYSKPCIHYMCTCLAWRYQPRPSFMRTCKHLRAYLGDEYESARTAITGGSGEAQSGLSEDGGGKGSWFGLRYK